LNGKSVCEWNFCRFFYNKVLQKLLIRRRKLIFSCDVFLEEDGGEKMERKNMRFIGVSLLILTLVAAVTTQSASAMTLKKVTTWFWGGAGGETEIVSTAVGDVDGDGKTEIVTGGSWLDGSERHNAQLCVWDATTLALEHVQSWRYPGVYTESWIESVAIGDVDGDGKNEVVTGGYYMDDSWVHYMHAQLAVWDGATLALEKATDWQEPGNDTYISSVAVADVDGDGKTDIVTGGNIRNRAPTPDRTYGQLCVWNGATLALKDEFTLWILFNWWFNSIAVGDVDGDAHTEIVTGGSVEFMGYRIAFIWVWDGATLLSEKYVDWSWSTTDTHVNSVYVGNVDGIFNTMEIVTGGAYFDGTRYVAQLVVWDGATLAVNKVQNWDWGGTGSYGTEIESVAVGDVDGTGIFVRDIITGGFWFNNGFNAQLCAWDGATLALKGNPTVWKWSGGSGIDCVAVGDVDGDFKDEMITGGYWYNSYEYEWWAQLCVWDW
jgi:hypothetical protein